MTSRHKYASHIHATIPDESASLIQQIHKLTRCHQFLMKLQYYFEPVCDASLLNQSPTPSLDACLKDLLREKQWCRS